MELEVRPTLIGVGKACIEVSVTERGVPVDAELRILGCGIEESYHVAGKKTTIEINTTVPGILTLIATNPLYASATAIIKVVASFDDLKSKCLRNDEVRCDWNTLHGYLLDNTVSNNWWQLTKGQRISILNKILTELFPYAVEYICEGKDNCEGGEGSYKTAVCLHNSAIRVTRLGSPVYNDKKLYYNTRQDHKTDICFGLEYYNLPAYCAGVFGHEIAALQIGENPDEPSSWRLFQYRDFDIKPGDWNMPYINPISVLEIEKLRGICIGDGIGLDTEVYKTFVFEPEGELRAPKPIVLYLKITPNPTDISVPGSLTQENDTFITHTSEGIFPVWISFDDGSEWYEVLSVSETHVGKIFVGTWPPKTIAYEKTATFTVDDKIIAITVGPGEIHDTKLSIYIQDSNGNTLTKAYVGDTVYVVGTLRDVETGELLQGEEIHLYKNSTNTNLSDVTDEHGRYSIPYTVVASDYPSVTFKTKFEGGGGEE